MNPTPTPDAVQMCPKRGWVLSVLADDDCGAEGQEVPRGLQLHLSRCPTCRQVAERLLLVTSRLERLASTEVPEALETDADYVAFAALRTGRSPSIHVPTAEAVDEVLMDNEEGRRRRGRWVLRGLATAALLAFAVLFAQAWRTATSAPSASNRRPDSAPALPDRNEAMRESLQEAEYADHSPLGAPDDAAQPTEDPKPDGVLERKIDEAQMPWQPEEGKGIRPTSKRD